MNSDAVAAAATCPLCGHTNDCALCRTDGAAPAASDCWCRSVAFTPALLAAAAPARACICRRCAELSNQPPEP